MHETAVYVEAHLIMVRCGDEVYTTDEIPDECAMCGSEI